MIGPGRVASGVPIILRMVGAQAQAVIRRLDVEAARDAGALPLGEHQHRMSRDLEKAP